MNADEIKILSEELLMCMDLEYKEDFYFNEMFPKIKIETREDWFNNTKNKEKYYHGKPYRYGKPTPLEEVLEDYSYIFLIGDAGSGKTTAINYLEAKLLSRKEPVYKIKLKYFQELNISEKGLPKGTIIIFDGLDELYLSLEHNAKYTDKFKKLKEIIAKLKDKDYKIIITSRYDVEDDVFDGFQRAYMQKYWDSQIKAILVDNDIDDEMEIFKSKVYRTPLFLKIILNLRVDSIQATEAEILKAYFKKQVNNKGGEDSVGNLEKIGEWFLADRTWQCDKPELEETVFNKYFGSIFRIEEKMGDKGLEEKILSCEHEIFCDFAIASYIAKLMSRTDLSIEYLKGKFADGNDFCTQANIGIFSRKSLWFIGQILRINKNRKEIIEKNFKKAFNKKNAKNISLFDAYMVNIFVSYNNDVINKQSYLRTGIYYAVLEKYGFLGEIDFELKKPKYNLFPYNYLICKGKRKKIMNREGKNFYNIEETISLLMEAEVESKDDEILKEAIEKQPEILQLRKNYNEAEEINKSLGKLAKDFGRKFGFDVFNEKVDYRKSGEDIKFIIKEYFNYEEECMKVIENIARKAINKENAHQLCVKKMESYKAEGDMWNYFLYARTMKEFSIASDEEYLNLKRTLEES